MVAVRFEHVWKLFGDNPVVVDLDMDVHDGEFLVLVGASGCGKTTSLRMLAGLERPSYGSIWMDDQNVTFLAPGKRDIAMVFQNYALYPTMSIEKNLAFGPIVRREDKRHLRERVKETATVLGLEDLLHRSPRELSGGQRQRVALGRALIRQPRLFLLDEPLSNLDAALRVQMREELIRLHQQLAVTTVYVTHDQVEAMTMGDRITLMDQGRLVQIGTPAELYDNPSNLNAATFIGTPKMNVFGGELMSADGLLSLRMLGTTTSLTSYQIDQLRRSASSTVTVGLRPVDLYWTPEAPQGCIGRLRCTAEIIEHLGSESFAIVTCAGASLKARLSRTARIAQGDDLEFCFNPGDLYFFDSQSHQSLLDRTLSEPTIHPALDSASSSI